MLDLDFDSDEHDVSNPANYLLAGAGPDETLQTTDCVSGLAGDDEGTLFGPPMVTLGQEAILEFETLRAQLYRLLICSSLLDLFGNPLDGDGDGTGGDDAMLTFRADPDNSLVNGHFDWDLFGWTATPADSFVRDVEDSHSSSDSGSARTTFDFAPAAAAGSTNGPVGLDQCADMPGGSTAVLAADVRLDTSPGVTVDLRRTCTFHAGPSCDGTALGTVDLHDPLTDTAGAWLRFADSVVVPGNAASARCSFAFEAAGGSSIDGFLDRLFFGIPTLFVDGFETGDTSRWSGTVGEP